MSTTLKTLRQRMAEAMGMWNGTLATTGAGTTSTFVSTDLANLAGGADTDSMADWYAIITETGHAAIGGVKRTTAYDAVSQLTVASAYGTAPGNGCDFELHRYNINWMHDAINAALRQTYNRGLWLPVRNETLVVDNILLNPDMEDGATNVFTGWTQTVGTWTESATRVWHGARSATVTAGGGAAARLTQDRFSAVNIHDVAGRTIHFKGRVFATAANVARLRLSFDSGSTFTNGAYHAGSSEWEGPGTIYVAATIPTTATTLTHYCEVAASGTAFFDSVFSYIDGIHQYTVPSAILNSPSFVYYQADLNDEDGDYIELPGWKTTRSGETQYLQMTQKPPAGHRLRIVGKGALTALSADVDTTEINGTQVDMIAELAAALMYERLASGPSTQQQASFTERATYHRARAEELQHRSGVRMAGAAQYRRVGVIG